MARIRQGDPARSKSAAVRLAMLRPSRRQLRRWQRDQRAARAIWLGLAGIVAVAALIIGIGYVYETWWRGGATVATVYGEPIILSEVVDRAQPRAKLLDQQLRFYQSQGQNAAQALSQVTAQRARLADQTLDSMIEDRLVAHELDRRGIPISDDELAQRIRKDVAEQDSFTRPRPTSTPTAIGAVVASPTAAPPTTPTPVPTLAGTDYELAYRAMLDRTGQSESQYRDGIRSQLQREKLRETMRKDLPTTEDQVHARHILLNADDQVQKAQEMLQQGVSFDGVARQLSADPGTRDKGGDLGWFGRGVMNATFESVAFNQQPGVIGEPFRSPNGQHIVLVIERDPNRTLTPEQMDRKAAQAYQAWYAGRKDSSDVTNALSEESRAWIARATRAPGSQ
jgi:parvulin-like peptidyl-prolyl isomerase